MAKMISNNITYLPARLGEAKTTLADITKAKTILNWNPSIKLKDWLNKILK
jgi:nucleoside-diphosphate-sugar epimerase